MVRLVVGFGGWWRWSSSCNVGGDRGGDVKLLVVALVGGGWGW